MSARSQVTLWAQGGGVGEEVTEDQMGSPERLRSVNKSLVVEGMSINVPD
jgi:hypothetical protein